MNSYLLHSYLTLDVLFVQFQNTWQDFLLVPVTVYYPLAVNNVQLLVIYIRK